MKIARYLKTLCPECGSSHHKGIGTHRQGCVKVRYHHCQACHHRFVSHEQVRHEPVIAVQKMDTS